MKIFESNSFLLILVQTVCIIWMVNSSEINENGLVDANMSPNQDKFDDVTTVLSDDDLKILLKDVLRELKFERLVDCIKNNNSEDCADLKSETEAFNSVNKRGLYRAAKRMNEGSNGILLLLKSALNKNLKFRSNYQTTRF